MRDDAPRKEVPGNGAEEDDASRQAKAKARAAAGDHERGLAPSEEPAPPDASGDSSGAVKGDPAE
jgi:hypothetical protein